MTPTWMKSYFADRLDAWYTAVDFAEDAMLHVNSLPEGERASMLTNHCEVAVILENEYNERFM